MKKIKNWKWRWVKSHSSWRKLRAENEVSTVVSATMVANEKTESILIDYLVLRQAWLLAYPADKNFAEYEAQIGVVDSKASTKERPLLK